MADTPPVDATSEFRAVVICSDDPCSYCRAPATEHRTEKVHATAEEAAEHGHGLAVRVWGLGVHHVEVEMRTVSPWQRIGSPARTTGRQRSSVAATS